MTKAEHSRNTCYNWESDWGGLRGSQEPSAKDIIRATAASGWYGHSRAIREVYTLPMSGGWVSTVRPAKCTVSADGMSRSMVSVSGVNPYATMANLGRAKALITRYRRFCQHMSEDRHKWAAIERIHYADNSTAVRERSTLTGYVRERMISAPSGDLCF